MALTLVSGPDIISYTRNIINVVVTLETDPEYTDVYALCNIYDSSSNLVVSLFARPDDDYNVTYSIASVLDSITSFSNIQPNVLNEKNTTAAIRYYCHVVQYSKSVMVNGINIGLTGGNPSLYAFKGGIDLNHISTDIFNLLKTNDMWLTWLTSDFVLLDQPYYLYYLHQYDSAFLTVQAKVYYTDGSSDTKTLTDFGEVPKYTLLKVATGFNQQSLGDLQPTKTPMYYEVWINSLAQIFTFNISTSYFPSAKYLAYANSLGGFSYMFLGNLKNNIVPTFTETEKPNEAGNRKNSFAYLIEKEITGYSGHISKLKADSLTDLFTSDSRFELFNDSFLKIAIDKKSKIEYSETENLNSATIIYSRSNINRNYTPDVTS